MGFPGALGPEFQQVVIALAIRDQADQRQQLGATSEHLGIESHALHQHVHPLFSGEFGPRFEKLIVIYPGHLDRLERIDLPRAGLGIVSHLVRYIGNAPDAAHQQLGETADEIVGHRHFLEAEIGELSFIESASVIQFDRELVNDLMAALFLDGGLDQLRLIPMHIVLGQNALDRFQAGLDRLRIVGGAMLAQQIFQHVGRHDGVLLQSFGQVLAHDQAGKMQQYLLIQRAQLAWRGNQRLR